MAASLHQFLLLLCFISSSESSLPRAVRFPVTKDASTLQYITQIYMGKHQSTPTKLVVDLGGPFLWVDCASKHLSSSHQPISSVSLHCSTAKVNSSVSWPSHGKKCAIHPENTITRMAASGELAEEVVAVDYLDGSKPTSISTIEHLLFSSAPTSLLKGLAIGVKGMLGLGRTRISLPTQLSNTFGFHRKFSICLSSSEGVIFSGDSATGIAKSLVYTPIIGTSEKYYISVKSIKINGKRLSVDKQEAEISTIVPYTTMESTIYNTFVKAYIKAALSLNMTLVAPVAPFGVCFSSPAGENVPAIDLVLQSEMVKWRICGRNSMVKVSDKEMCLGFLDGGSNPRASIVIGGYQLEDNLLEFNLGTSMLGFSSSLLMRQTTCSKFMLSSKPIDSI